MRLLGYVRTPTAAQKILEVATRSGVTDAVLVKLGADQIFTDLRSEQGRVVLLVDAVFTRPESGRFTSRVLMSCPRSVVMIAGQLTAKAAAAAIAAGSGGEEGICCLFPSRGEDEGFEAAVSAAVGLLPGVAGGAVDISPNGGPPLSAREMQVLVGMTQGRSNSEIGRDLMLSEETVKTHSRRLFRKLGAKGRSHAVAIAFRTGLVR